MGPERQRGTCCDVAWRYASNLNKIQRGLNIYGIYMTFLITLLAHYPKYEKSVRQCIQFRIYGHPDFQFYYEAAHLLYPAHVPRDKGLRRTKRVTQNLH